LAGGAKTPAKGDLVYWNPGSGSDRKASHIGIVVSYNASTQTVTTVEGNSGDNTDRVKSNQIDLDDSNIKGFLRY
jgi:hypothetical protein